MYEKHVFLRGVFESAVIYIEPSPPLTDSKQTDGEFAPLKGHCSHRPSTHHRFGK